MQISLILTKSDLKRLDHIYPLLRQGN